MLKNNLLMQKVDGFARWQTIERKLPKLLKLWTKQAYIDRMISQQNTNLYSQGGIQGKEKLFPE